MRREQREKDFHRILGLVNYCNTQVLNLNEQSIIRTILTHVSDDPNGMSVPPLEQLADEAHISQASISRFVRKVGYASYAEFRENFPREFDLLYYGRERKHRNFLGTGTRKDIPQKVFEQHARNIHSTLERTDWDLLFQAVSELASARSVFILGDDHVLSDFYTFQLDLLSNGIGAYLHKNVEAQEMQADALEEGDVLLYVSACIDWVTPNHRNILSVARACKGVRTIIISQDGEQELDPLCDIFIAYGVPGSRNLGFTSLWMVSNVMSEMLYEV